MLKPLIHTGVNMKAIESKLDELLVKKAPKLPDNLKKGIVTAMPWLTLIVGVLALFGAWGVYQLASWANSWMGVANELGATYGLYAGYSASFGPLLWVSLALLVAEAVMSFMAFSPLKAHQKRGWDLLYWLALLNVVYAVVSLISVPNLMQFLFSLVFSVLGLYVLFQIRSSYSGASAA